MPWIIKRSIVIEKLKAGAILTEWSNGVQGFTYNIIPYTVRIDTAQKLIKDKLVVQLPPEPMRTYLAYIWNRETNA